VAVAKGDTSSTSQNAGTSPVALAHDVAGSNTLLLVGISARSGSTVAVTGVTYNGDAMDEAVNSTAASRYCGIWYLVNPDPGTANVSVAWTNSGSTPQIVLGAVTFTGVDQSVPLGTAASASATDTTPTVNVTVSADGMAMDTLFAPGAPVATPSHDQEWNLALGSVTRGASQTTTDTGVVAMAWTLDSSQLWRIVAVPIEPAAPAIGRSFAVMID
jgi:hypothetical protein